MWMKVDDRLHAHRKTRKVVSSGDGKRRDVAPMGLWVLAGAWVGQNATDGWVPEHELDRWDDDWEALVDRLVRAEYWWPEMRDGEPGYAFVDWEDYNPSHKSSESGEYGNHIRWHVKRAIVDPECKHCPQEPASSDSPPEHPAPSGSDIGGRSGGDIAPESRNVALPDPTRPEPDPKTSSSEVADATSRPDVTEILDYLDAKIRENDPERKLPNRTKKNIDAARLLLDKDGKSIEQVKAAIKFSQDDEFWRANIFSMSKLREKYEQLRAKAMQTGAMERPQTEDRYANYPRAPRRHA